MLDLEKLKTSAGFTEEDERYLRLAGELLAVIILPKTRGQGGAYSG
jgi:hypothetical protein